MLMTTLLALVGCGAGTQDMATGAHPGGVEGRFLADGVRLTTAKSAVSIRTVAVGDAALRLASPRPGTCGAVACVEYTAPGVTEWWIQQSTGFEQGWTVTSRPAGGLSVDVAVSGAKARMHGRDLVLGGAGGPIAVSKLAARDAAGRDLPAVFSVSNAGFRVSVDDAGAVYPVVIDPVYTTATSTLDGEAADDRFGYSVSAAGDVNGDGYSDVIVGAPGHGRAYVYLGSAAGLVTPAATTLEGTVEERFGYAVTGGGDFNHDGFADVAVGAPGPADVVCEVPADTDSDTDTAVDTGDPPIPGPTGSVYVYLGSASGLSTTATTLVGEDGCDLFGSAVAMAGDIHDDDRSDLAVGAWAHDGGAGRAYLYSGSSTGISTTSSYTVSGYAGARLGAAVGAAGDVGRDGFGDLAIGAPGVSAVFVYGGGSFGLSDVRLNTITSGLADFGSSLSTADVDGDRYGDVIIGASGTVGVYHGSVIGPSTTADESFEGDRGVGVGDLDDDGYDEIAVVTSDGILVYEGSATGTSSTAVATLTAEGSSDEFGASLAGPGDVNGDGADDIFVGAPGYGDDTGRAYYFKGYDDTDADGDTYNATDDCDDTNGAIHPGAVEACDPDNADEDCNGLADDAAATGQSTFYADSDADNYGDPASSISACDAPEGYVVDKTDCDDTKYAVNPKATEICNGFDDNCDGSTDGDDAEEPLIWYEDADGDGYPNPDVSTTQCAQPDGYVKLGEDDDCDDNDPATHPYAEEVAGDEIDQDCDGSDLADDGGCKGCASGSAGPAWLLGLVALGALRRRGR